MASFKYLIFFALTVYTVSATAEDGARVKKHAYIAAVPAPVLAYSAPAKGSYAYSIAHTASYPYATAAAYPAAAAYAAYPAAAYAAYPAAAAYPASYATYPASYAAYPSYPHDDGKYWPGKYEKTYFPAAYSVATYPHHY